MVNSQRLPTLGPYSQAVRVGNLVFTAGQPGLDPKTGQPAGNTFEPQARQAFENLRTILEEAGASLSSVVKVTCFIADSSALGKLNDLFKEFFPQSPPARSAPVVELPRGLLFSIDAIAVVHATQEGQET